MCPNCAAQWAAEAAHSMLAFVPRDEQTKDSTLFHARHFASKKTPR